MKALLAMIGAVSSLSGWRRMATAFAAGLAAALAQAPFHLFPLMAIGVSAVVLLIDGARAAPRAGRAGFAIGWAFGFGYFLLGLYWVAFSFLVQADEFAWMAPFAVAGLPAFLALFWGAAGAIAAKLKVAGFARIGVFVGLFMLAEYLRGHILTGLPWNLPGQALAGEALLAQSAAIWGVYGLSFIALLIAALPAAFAGRGARGLLHGAALSLAGFAALAAFGAARLALHPAADRGDAYVRLVQPDIAQRDKIDNANWQRNYDIHIALSEAPAPAAATLYILWPENAVPVIDEVQEGLDALAQRLPENSVLIAGAVRRTAPEITPTLYYNSISVIENRDGARVPTLHYDKHHLVPFGEYLPLQGMLRAIGLAQLAPYDDGFSAGAGPATLAAGGTRFSPLICYEAIFPGAVYPKGDRPDWIAAVTNDSWFGDSSGPRQHFDQARLRAIETGLPLARAANSGVSGLIDGAGRTRSRIALYEKGIIDAPLPVVLPPTLYDRLGDVPFFAMLLAALGAAFFRVRTTG